VTDFSVHLSHLYTDIDDFMNLSKGALEYFDRKLSWNAKGNEIDGIYDKLLERPTDV
jgi:hypothetical protein